MAAFNIPLKPDGSMYVIAIPSDISIFVQQITDIDGNPISLVDNYFKFVFSDSDGTELECIHDPVGGHSKNVVYYSDRNVLRLLVPTRDFVKGSMYCKSYTRKADSDFDDGEWDICTEKERINIKLAE